MVEIVEQASDVELYYPVIVPAAASGDGNSLQRRLARPIAVGIVAEDRINPWLQPHLYRRLRDSIGHRRHAQYADAPCLLRYRHSLHCRRKVAAGAHPI